MGDRRLESLLERLGVDADEPGLRVWRAPGRINLIGEHVDYTGGIVLPFACDLDVWLAAVPLSDTVVVSSLDEPGEVELDLRGEPAPSAGWGRYVGGVAQSLREIGAGTHGFRGALSSTIPIGAGLSSSAALEAVLALAMLRGERPTPEALQRAEHLAVGVPCGVMDQVAVLHGRAGHALAIDCASVTWRPVRLPPVGLVVIDTGTRRRLDDGRYATRREEVESALRVIGIGSPRETALDELDGLAEPARRRLRHVVSENQRVQRFLSAVEAGDIVTMGVLLDESHASLRDDFEVSSPELDRAVRAARAHLECLGARIVGAGFAGCALALVHPGAEERFARSLPGFRAFPVTAVDGAGELLARL